MQLKKQAIDNFDKIEELALYFVLFIQNWQLKEKAFPPVMRSVSAVAIGVF